MGQPETCFVRLHLFRAASLEGCGIYLANLSRRIKAVFPRVCGQGKLSKADSTLYWQLEQCAEEEV